MQFFVYSFFGKNIEILGWFLFFGSFVITAAKSSNSHPYEREILTLLTNSQLDYDIFDEIAMTGMTKSHIWVESESQLRELVYVLSEQKLFAVDTEQHSLRSFLGFTALVQVTCYSVSLNMFGGFLYLIKFLIVICHDMPSRFLRWRKIILWTPLHYMTICICCSLFSLIQILLR